MHAFPHTAALVGGIIALLLVASAILGLTKRLHLPFTVMLVLVGLFLSWLSDQYPDNLYMLKELAISPDLILFVFLPTLIFETTFNLDGRMLRHNIGPILTLAVPGLLISTLLIGTLVWLATPIDFVPSLLLGAILSATDPVAVVALFRQIGAPKRLNILIEGESLFNDATSIVLARILIGIIAAGTLSWETLGQGLVDFVVLFAGGLLVGIVLGWIVGWIIGRIESEPFIEISLTTALAYLSFLLSEEVFHVSGVMATVGAGLTLGGWGRVKISASVRDYLESFWAYMAFIANALIFLMVGLAIRPEALLGSLDLLLWVILAMLIARAAMVYGLMPLVGRLPGSKPVSLAYQTVMYWGGLRGAIALAIVLSLPELPYSELFVALVTGAVLFTLLVQGLSIETLMKYLKLDRPPLLKQVSSLECELLANGYALERIPELKAGGLFSATIAQQLTVQCKEQERVVQKQLDTLRHGTLTQEQELSLLYQRTLAEEKLLYFNLFNKGHLSEGAYRELAVVLHMQIDAVRHHGALEHIHAYRIRRQVERFSYRLLENLPLLGDVIEHRRTKHLLRSYEIAWGHYQGSRHVLQHLDELRKLEDIPQALYEQVYQHYRHWQVQAKSQIDTMHEQFPELVQTMQQRLGKRMILLAKEKAIEEQAVRGLLSRDHAEELKVSIATQIGRLRSGNVSLLHEEPEFLLRRVPLFQNIPAEHFAEIARHLKPLTLEEGETIIRQGEVGKALYVIAHGVVRVSREEDGIKEDLGTLMAGDFFGEMALLGHQSRNASVYTVSPCRLYSLSRSDLEKIVDQYPKIAEILREADAERRHRIH